MSLDSVRGPLDDLRAGAPPDIGVLGRYTYLATEVVWGAVAAALLYRTGAFRRAAKTIVALYPIAYAWDRYTLDVGVFSIDLRTGVDVLDIPLEEHLFMVVVPGLVVGMHELLHGDPSERADTPERSAPSERETDESSEQEL